MKTLTHEDQSAYNQLLASYNSDFQPATTHEQFLVAQLAESRCRLDRFRRLEAQALSAIIDPSQIDETNPDARIVASLGPNALMTLNRWAAAAEKSYFRAHRELTQARSREMRNKATEAQVWLKNNFKRCRQSPHPTAATLQNEPKSGPRMPKHTFRRRPRHAPLPDGTNPNDQPIHSTHSSDSSPATPKSPATVHRYPKTTNRSAIYITSIGQHSGGRGLPTPANPAIARHVTTRSVHCRGIDRHPYTAPSNAPAIAASVSVSPPRITESTTPASTLPACNNCQNAFRNEPKTPGSPVARPPPGPPQSLHQSPIHTSPRRLPLRPLEHRPRLRPTPDRIRNRRRKQPARFPAHPVRMRQTRVRKPRLPRLLRPARHPNRTHPHQRPIRHTRRIRPALPTPPESFPHPKRIRPIPCRIRRTRLLQIEPIRPHHRPRQHQRHLRIVGRLPRHRPPSPPTHQPPQPLRILRPNAPPRPSPPPPPPAHPPQTAPSRNPAPGSANPDPQSPGPSPAI